MAEASSRLLSRPPSSRGRRYLLMAVRSGSAILLAVASACLLLTEAMVAVALARNWQLT